MTQEEKQLLLVDLCARLPYMPKIKIIYQQQGIKGTDEGNVSCDAIEHIVNDLRNGVITDMQIYLRPMSSMTEEERKEYEDFIIHREHVNAQGQEWDIDCFSFAGAPRLIDWLNEHHFDYRELIDKGLAIEVTEENNPYR